MHGRLLWLDDREPRSDAIINPSMAQFHLWLAQAQRDRGNLSDKEMAKMEGCTTEARKAKLMFNPFTGEVRKFNSNFEIDEPTEVYLGGAKIRK